MIKFERNHAKAAQNIDEHGISFEEASTVFYDDFAVQFYDETPFELVKDRFLILCISNQSRIPIVCYCERQLGYVLRTISARKATKSERVFYQGDA